MEQKTVCSSCLDKFDNNKIDKEHNCCELCVRRKSYTLDDVMMSFAFANPFYASISRYCHKIETEHLPTMGVCINNLGKISMFYNDKFFKSMSWVEKFEVLKHEFLHLIFEHCAPLKMETHRVKNSTNRKIWNWATDLAINSLLDINKLPRFCLYPGRACEISESYQKVLDELPEEDRKAELERIQRLNDFLLTLPTQEASEYYYKKLLENPDIAQDIAMSGIGYLDEHDDWFANLPEEQQKIIREKIKTMIRESVLEADRKNNWGNIPGELQKQIRKIVSNEINWKNVLQQFIGMCRARDSKRTIKKIDKRYPYVHPGSKKKRTSRIAIAVDQSGSVSDETLEMFFAELENLSDLVDFTVIPFDADVNNDQVFVWKRGQKREFERVRCGGTDFSVPTQWVNEKARDFDGFVILTDGYCEKPISSKIKRAYVICPDGKLAFETTDLVIQMTK